MRTRQMRRYSGRSRATEDKSKKKNKLMRKCFILHPHPDASGEAVAPRLPRKQNQPSKREVEEHRRNSHLPYRPWCKLCVFGKGKHDQHRSGLKQKTNLTSKHASENPILCTYDNGTGSLGAYVTKGKGLVPWLPKAVGSDIDCLGYGGCRISMK